MHYFGFVSRVQCLSNLAQLQQGGSMNSHVAQLTEVRSRKSNQSGSGLSKRDSLLVKQESTENLLKEKDDEIKRMQAMIAQMQTQLQSGATSLNSNDSTMVWRKKQKKFFLWKTKIMRISKTYTKDDFLPPIFKYFLHGYVLIYHSVLFQSNKVFTKLPAIIMIQ